MRSPAIVLFLCGLFLPGICAARPLEPKETKPIPEIPTREAAVAMPGQARGLSAYGLHDTVTYGGTWWAPDSARWEAIRDSVWTFDTGIGSSINTGFNPNKPVGYHQQMEGWYGIDQTLATMSYFRRSNVCAISGSWSLWAGVTQAEANSMCYVAGQGYGNSWNLAAQKTFSYTGPGTVTLQYDYAIDAEPGFDYAYVLIDSTGNGAADAVVLATYTGAVNGHQSITMTRGVELPSGPYPKVVTIQFLAQSDGGYSDEDGAYSTTCGHSAWDNIRFTGGITDFTDFESGSNGWQQAIPTTAVGDFSNIVNRNTSLPPPATFCACGVKDSVLVLYDLLGKHPLDQDNIAASPWINLRRPANTADLGRPGRLILYQVYAELPIGAYVFAQIRARYYPEVCPATGLLYRTPWKDQNIIFYYGEAPFCNAPGFAQGRDYSPVIATGAEQIQIGFGVMNLCRQIDGIPCTGVTNTTPWIDNVALGVFGSAVAPAIQVLTLDFLQDNFATDGTLNPASTGRLDVNKLKNSTTPGPGSILGDTLVVGGDGGNQETRVVLRVRRAGPFTSAANLNAWKARLTLEPDGRPPLPWYSARLDTAEQGGYPTLGKWMACFHESDPGFQSTDRTPDPLDPSQLANDIFPDHLFTPGSRIDYFFKARYLPPDPRNPGGANWVLLPDTTGGRYFEVEVLPSSMASDTTWNCVLYVDHHHDRSLYDQQLEEQGLTAYLGLGGNTAEGTKYDRFDDQTPSSGMESFGRPIQTVYGASIVQAFAYKYIAWHCAELSSRQLTGEDANILGPWLTLRAVGGNRLWGSGSGLATSMDGSGSVSALSFMKNTLGVLRTCNTIRDANCPSTTTLDSTYCLPLGQVVGSYFASSVVPNGGGNGCPDLLSFDVVNANSAVPGALGNLTYVKNAVARNYASVVNWNTLNVDYKTVLDGVSVGKLRATPADPHQPRLCTVATASIARTADVLGWFGASGTDFKCRIPAAINEVPGREVPPPPQFRHALGNVFPNPQNRVTRIQFTNGVENGDVSLLIFDVTGRLVKTLVDGPMPAGVHEVLWDGSTDSGSRAPSGLYFCKMLAPAGPGNARYQASKKIVRLR